VRPLFPTAAIGPVGPSLVASEARTAVLLELLVKHGLAESVLDSATQALDQFDEAMVQGTEGRRAHVGASAELAEVADEIVEVVKLLDRFNRYRFANDANMLAGWESASNVVTPTHPAATPAPGGEVRPAA
jgi:hypothetical protein